MKLKLDENLGERGAALFRAAGHEVATVAEERLWRATDRELIHVCQQEGRCLITLDLDFSNPMVFRPRDYSGIAVLRLPPKSLDQDLWEVCKLLIEGLRQHSIVGKLWVVQRDRIREYRPDELEI